MRRSSWDDPTLVTDLEWRPHARRPGARRGALVGTLWGVPVTGKDIGRGTAFQFGLLDGEVRTVWWDGSMHFDAPRFFDVDTQESVQRNPAAVAWFDRLEALQNATPAKLPAKAESPFDLSTEEGK